jgi:anti-sigma regulatory factor (Ser/Thr protein kinase)
MTAAPSRTHYVSGLRLAAVLTAVGLSRAFARQTLRHWNLSTVADNAELVMSELVTNAVKSTGITDPNPKTWQIKAHHVVGVQLRALDRSLYVEVWDRDDASPVMQEQTLDAEGGRGLFLVEMLSKRWDIFRPAAGGKIVWAEQALPGPVNAPIQRAHLPQRVPGLLGPKAGAELNTATTALKQRVIDGLRAHQPPQVAS